MRWKFRKLAAFLLIVFTLAVCNPAAAYQILFKSGLLSQAYSNPRGYLLPFGSSVNSQDLVSACISNSYFEDEMLIYDVCLKTCRLHKSYEPIPNLGQPIIISSLIPGLWKPILLSESNLANVFGNDQNALIFINDGIPCNAGGGGGGGGDLDYDNDGISNTNDNCPSVPNSDQVNSDADKFGDACDNCLSVQNSDQTDSDGDGLGNACDNCPEVANENQADNDSDKIGDICDDDDDNDGVSDSYDNCHWVFNPDQTDYDYDGTGDACDEDDDADGVSDLDDLCPNTAAGVNFGLDGCSGEQIVGLECPCDGSWKNQGEYVSCVTHAAEDQVETGLITEEEKGSIVSERAKSGCGKKK
jgi:hypothetical protein